MIEIIILYMLIGCVIGLVTWIVDVFIPSSCCPLTGKILTLIVILWPYYLFACIKVSIRVIRRNRHDKY